MPRYSIFRIIAAAGPLIATAAFSPSDLSAQEAFSPNRLPDYVHPPILHPIPDGIKLTVPAELGNRRLSRLGYVDVTAAPFHADPTGRRDSTEALQRAIDFARDAQMVCFFPPGRYRVSDTLVLRHGIYMRSHRAALVNYRLMPCALVGKLQVDSQGRVVRPRIVLAPHSPGFDNPRRVKYVVEHQQYDVKKFTIEENRNGGGPSLMNTLFINLDIEIGEGNPGAAGMHIRSCEGSAVQNVTIDARHGYAGLVGATGNGGSWANVTILGGRIGIDMRGWTPPTPTMVGIRLFGQTQAALVHACRGSLTAVGVEIRSRIGGPLIVGEKTWGPFDGSLNLIDSSIRFESAASSKGRRTVLQSAGNVYMNRVYVYGADEIVSGILKGNRKGWIHVREFAWGKKRRRKGIDLDSPVYIDGRKIGRLWKDTVSSEEPPEALVARHLWDPRLVDVFGGRFVNVREQPYGARGDSVSDDTEALQRAIDEADCVFLPKGYYRITRPLKLRPNTRLVGVASHLSVIMAREPSQWPRKNGKLLPLVETANDPDARTVIAYLGIRIPLEVPRSGPLRTLPLYALHWRCGPRSLFLSNDVHPLRVFGFRRNKQHRPATLHHPTIVVSGAGGGRWYNYHTMQFFIPTSRTQRAILVRDTPGPLWFYNFEPQGGNGEAVAEFRRALHVSLFGCKTECNTTFVRVADCNHVRIFGHGGIGNAKNGQALYVVERTPNWLLANLADQVNLGPDRSYYNGHAVHRHLDSFYPLQVRDAQGRTVTVPSRERPVLYRVGNPLPAR